MRNPFPVVTYVGLSGHQIISLIVEKGEQMKNKLDFIGNHTYIHHKKLGPRKLINEEII